MARKSALLQRAGALTTRDKVWAAIRDLALSSPGVGGRASWFSIAELASLSGVSAELVYDNVLGLSRTQPPYLEAADRNRPMSRPRRDVCLWRLVRDIGVEAPRVTEEGKAHTVGLANQQVWDTMRRLKDFDVVELAAAASTPDCPVNKSTAKNLLAPLVNAGYVVKQRENKPALRGQPGTAVHARYAFVRSKNTGPRAPTVSKKDGLYDNNLGAIVWAPAKGDAGK